MDVEKGQNELAIDGEVFGLEQLDLGAGVHDRLGDAVARAVLEIAGDPARSAAQAPAENADVGFQTTFASRFAAGGASGGEGGVGG